jgi:Flp pilus assembly protein CpaB
LANRGIRARPGRSDPLPLLFWIVVFAGIPAVAVWMALRPESKAAIVVPVHDLAPYRVIGARDVTVTKVDRRDGASSALGDLSTVVGRYPLVALPGGRPIHSADLGPRPERRYVDGTVAVAIRSSSITSLGGAVRAGDIVTLTQIPAARAKPHVYQDVLMLDAGKSAVLVVAIPKRRWREFAAADRRAIYRVTTRVAGS